MTNDAQRVLAGFTKLSYSDRCEVIDAINAYMQLGDTERQALREKYQRFTAGFPVGPIGGTCPCCGR